MSVLIVNPKIFEEVYGKAVMYSFKNEVDIDYCETFRQMKEDDLTELVRVLCDLNEESFCGHYGYTLLKNKQSTLLNLQFSLLPVSAYQMLKNLYCIRYNIEVCCIPRELNPVEGQALVTLNRAIEEIALAIISTLPEYREAHYSQKHDNSNKYSELVRLVSNTEKN